MTETLLVVVLTVGCAVAVLLVFWLLVADSRPGSLQALERFELDFIEAERTNP